MSFYINPKDWEADRRTGAPQPLQDVYVLPTEILRMDARVRKSLESVLKSGGARRLHDAIRQSAAVYKGNAGWSCKLVFRAMFHFYWSHDLGWYLLPTSERAPKFWSFEQPLRRECHHCRSAFGSKRPSATLKKKSLGAVLRKVPVPMRIRDAELVIREELLRLRGRGTFDRPLKELAKTLEKSRRGILSYVIVPIAVYYHRDVPVASTSFAWLSPGIKGPEAEAALKIERSRARLYFKPCEYCRGEGGLA